MKDEDVKEGKMGASARLVEIVFDNIVEQFGDRLWILK
jgi:hypothetical protein